MEDRVSLVLGYFTEEDQEITVIEDLLPTRLAVGVRQSSNALAGYQGGAYRPTEGLAGVIEYPSMRDSYRLTDQPALVSGARMQHAFTWVFVIQEVQSRMMEAPAAGGFGVGLCLVGCSS